LASMPRTWRVSCLIGTTSPYAWHPSSKKSDIAETVLRATRAGGGVNFFDRRVSFQSLVRNYIPPLPISHVQGAQWVTWKLGKNKLRRQPHTMRPRSKFDLVHFMWESFALYFLNHAITVGWGSPREKEMFLSDNRASSSGRGSRACTACLEMFDGIYEVNLECTCTVCRLEHTSLKADASQIVFRFVYDPQISVSKTKRRTASIGTPCATAVTCAPSNSSLSTSHSSCISDIVVQTLSCDGSNTSIAWLS
jgi:hypothetical protein